MTTTQKITLVVTHILVLALGLIFGLAIQNEADATALDERAAELDTREGELDQRESDLDQQEESLGEIPFEEPLEEPEPEPTPAEDTTLKIGDSIDVSLYGSEVAKVAVTLEDTSTGPTYDIGEAPANGVFVMFKVDVTATDFFEIADDQFYVLVDGDRYEWLDGNSWDALEEGTMGYVELNAGEHRDGMIAFDLPEEHGTLAYAPNYGEGPLATWEF